LHTALLSEFPKLHFVSKEEVHFFKVDPAPCEDRVLDGPASGGKGSKGRN